METAAKTELARGETLLAQQGGVLRLLVARLPTDKRRSTDLSSPALVLGSWTVGTVASGDPVAASRSAVN